MLHEKTGEDIPNISLENARGKKWEYALASKKLQVATVFKVDLRVGGGYRLITQSSPNRSLNIRFAADRKPAGNGLLRLWKEERHVWHTKQVQGASCPLLEIKKNEKEYGICLKQFKTREESIRKETFDFHIGLATPNIQKYRNMMEHAYFWSGRPFGKLWSFRFLPQEGVDPIRQKEDKCGADCNSAADGGRTFFEAQKGLKTRRFVEVV